MTQTRPFPAFFSVVHYVNHAVKGTNVISRPFSWFSEDGEIGSAAGCYAENSKAEARRDLCLFIPISCRKDGICLWSMTIPGAFWPFSASSRPSLALGGLPPHAAHLASHTSQTHLHFPQNLEIFPKDTFAEGLLLRCHDLSSQQDTVNGDDLDSDWLRWKSLDSDWPRRLLRRLTGIVRRKRNKYGGEGYGPKLISWRCWGKRGFL